MYIYVGVDRRYYDLIQGKKGRELRESVLWKESVEGNKRQLCNGNNTIVVMGVGTREWRERERIHAED